MKCSPISLTDCRGNMAHAQTHTHSHNMSATGPGGNVPSSIYGTLNFRLKLTPVNWGLTVSGGFVGLRLSNKLPTILTKILQQLVFCRLTEYLNILCFAPTQDTGCGDSHSEVRLAVFGRSSRANVSLRCRWCASPLADALRVVQSPT